MLLLMVVVEYTQVVTLCACIIVWSGCDYFQCDREIRFMCDGGKGGAKVDGGRWTYVVGCQNNLHFRHIRTCLLLDGDHRRRCYMQWPRLLLCTAN